MPRPAYVLPQSKECGLSTSRRTTVPTNKAKVGRKYAALSVLNKYTTVAKSKNAISSLTVSIHRPGLGKKRISSGKAPITR